MGLLPIILVLREEVEQQTLLVGDPVIEKVPRRSSIEDRAHRVVEENLGTDREVEPAGIGGVAEKPAVEQRSQPYAYKPVVTS